MQCRLALCVTNTDCCVAHPAARPHVSQNLFDLYGLNGLAETVARTNANGEKINKMRKSYENHIKVLQIAGKPKAVKMDGVFMELLAWPDAEFENQRVKAREYKTVVDIEKGGLTQEWDVKLNEAFAGMGPGPLPAGDAQRYRAYIGTDDKPKAHTEGLQSRAVQSASATPRPVNSTIASRAVRPERSGAKRSYTDVSFQGYGEGFTDDGYADSNGGDDGQGGVKRRKLGFDRTSHSVEVGGARR